MNRNAECRMQNAETPRRKGRSAFCILHSALAIALVIAFALPQVAEACAVCYGNPQSQLTKAADNGTLFLLGVVGFVQIGFIAFFWTLWRRAKANQRHREQFHVIHGGVR